MATQLFKNMFCSSLTDSAITVWKITLSLLEKDASPYPSTIKSSFNARLTFLKIVM